MPKKALFSFFTLMVLSLLIAVVLSSASAQYAYAQGGTQAPTQAATAASSQSGESRLVYVDVNSPYKLNAIILNPGDKSHHTITNPSGVNMFNVLLSPNGKSIAFSSTLLRLGKNNALAVNLYTMNLDGTNLHQLSNDTVSFSSDTGYGNFPFGWSSDGLKVFYLYFKYQAQLNPPTSVPLTTALYVTNADGSDKPQQIQPSGTVINGASLLLALSPDGQQILFTGVQSNDPTTKEPPVLLTTSIDGQNVQPFKQKTAASMAYSPDGKHVVLTVSDSKTTSIIITDADGSNPQPVPLTDPIQPVSAAAIVWSPDGTQIAFVGADKQQKQHIYIVNTDGSNLKAVADVTAVVSLSWGIIPSDVLNIVLKGTPTRTPLPSRTPKPSATPKPSSTPRPSSTPKPSSTPRS